MKYSRLLAFALVSLFTYYSYAQVTIGSGVTPQSFSVLELDGKNGGLRLNNLTTAERNLLNVGSNTLAKGLIIFNTTTQTVEYWDGTVWVPLTNVTASNGLTKTANDIKLGGTFTNDVILNTNSNRLSIRGGIANFFNITDANASSTIVSVDAVNKSVGIGTSTPDASAILDLTTTDKGLKLPRVALQATNVAAPVTSPAIGLLVYNTANASTGTTEVFANKLYAWNGSLWTMIVDQTTFTSTLQTELNNLGVPRPAVFQLGSNISDFLNGVGLGGKSSVPMNLLINNLPNDISFNTTTNEITFLRAGLYTMTFVYEASHNAAGCTIASYIVDFPDANGGLGIPPNASITHIHSTATFNQGSTSNHGNTVSCTAFVTAGRVWRIELGRGQSGNCTGAGALLVAKSTHFVISKVGN